jgi:hypothetical protein
MAQDCRQGLGLLATAAARPTGTGADGKSNMAGALDRRASWELGTIDGVRCGAYLREQTALCVLTQRMIVRRGTRNDVCVCVFFLAFTLAQRP